MPTKQKRKIRVLVVEDSAYNRQAIIDMIESDGDLEVVGLAGNGEEGLKELLRLQPDVVTLDLEMPRMDGFTFLRILMNRRPTPVIVISSHSHKQNVFKALELGALDFIAKPARFFTSEIKSIREELLEKLKLVRLLEHFHQPQSQVTTPAPDLPLKAVSREKPLLIAIGASTGGPPALQRLLAKLPANLPVAILIAQHMPAGFTKAFAERLDRYTNLEVSEAEGGETPVAGHVYICPGGCHLRLAVKEGGDWQLVVEQASPDSKYVPSIDLLLQSVAALAAKRSCAVLLTGMGTDGRLGMEAIKQAGGKTVAESEESAVIFGMPKEAIDSGCVDVVCRLEDIAGELIRFAEDNNKS